MHHSATVQPTGYMFAHQDMPMSRVQNYRKVITMGVKNGTLSAPLFTKVKIVWELKSLRWTEIKIWFLEIEPISLSSCNFYLACQSFLDPDWQSGILGAWKIGEERLPGAGILFVLSPSLPPSLPAIRLFSFQPFYFFADSVLNTNWYCASFPYPRKRSPLAGHSGQVRPNDADEWCEWSVSAI